MMKYNKGYPAILAALIILLITLNPFQFQFNTVSWDDDFWLLDIGQNIALFIPLGILLRQTRTLSLGLIFLICLGLTGLIESLQSFAPTRYGNAYDLASNAMGGLLGGVIAVTLFKNSPSKSFINLSAVVLLLCWIIGLQSRTEITALVALSPFALVGALSVHQATFGKMKKVLAVFGWSVLCCVSIVSIIPTFRLLIGLAIFLLTVLLARICTRQTRILRIAFISGTFLFLLFLVTWIVIQLRTSEMLGHLWWIQGFALLSAWLVVPKNILSPEKG